MDRICITVLLLSVGLDGIIGGPSLLDDPALSPGGAINGECSACLRGQCRSISGLYTRPDLPPGYSLVAQIPQGACRLIIQQLKHTSNILGLRNSNGSYILNGEWKFSHSMTVEGAGTHFTYRKQDTASVETITAPGPLSNPVDIVIYYQQPNPGIKYGYSIPISAPSIGPLHSPGGPIYRHHEAPIDEAPTSDIGILDTHRYDTDGNNVQQHPHHGGSGGGSSSREFHQHPNVVGVQKDQAGGGSVHPHRRGGRIGRRRFMWKVTGAETCSKPCGGGTQAPIYTCIREITQTPVPERRCIHLEKPAMPQLRCNMHSCADDGDDLSGAEQRVDAPPLPPINTPQGHWAGRWEPCNVSCGQGVQHYRVHCIQEIGAAGRTVTLSDSDCPPPKPAENRRACALAPCDPNRSKDVDDPSDNELPRHPEDRLKKTWPPYADWQTGPWSACSVSCGMGQRTRSVTCHVSSECRPDTRPFHAEYCETGPCPTTPASFTPGGQTPNTHWLVTEWSVCSELCGTGTQHRRGYCARPPCGGTDTTPETSRQCSSERACAGQWFAGPWSACSDPCTGLSIQTREVYCIGKVRNGHSHYQPRITQDMTCSMTERPPTERPCVGDGSIRIGSGGYCPVQWFQGEWGDCENCEYSGSGIQRRDVRCIRPTDGGSNDLIGGQPASGCKVDEQPLMKRPCACARNHGNMQPVQTATPMPPYARTHAHATAKPTMPVVKTIVQDQPGDSGCVDKIRNCYLAVQARLCQYPYYAAHCCTSCKRAPQDQD